MKKMTYSSLSGVFGSSIDVKGILFDAHSRPKAEKEASARPYCQEKEVDESFLV